MRKSNAGTAHPKTNRSARGRRPASRVRYHGACLTSEGHSPVPARNRVLPAFPALPIAKARISDIPSLDALEQRCFDSSVAISQRQFRYLISRPTANIWVCRTDGQVAADLVLLCRQTRRGLHGRIYSLVVAPEHRGRGYARRLLQHCLRELRGAGAYVASLEVHPDNEPALRLYAQEGFKQAAVLQDYYAPGDDAVRLITTLQDKKSK